MKTQIEILGIFLKGITLFFAICAIISIIGSWSYLWGYDSGWRASERAAVERAEQAKYYEDHIKPERKTNPDAEEYLRPS